MNGAHLLGLKLREVGGMYGKAREVGGNPPTQPTL